MKEAVEIQLLQNPVLGKAIVEVESQ